MSTATRLPVLRWPRVGNGLPRPGATGLLAALVLAGALFPFAGSECWTFNVTVGLTLAISCLGLRVVTGWTRQISLMQAGLTGAATHLNGYLFGTRDGRYLTLGVRHHFLFAAAATIGCTVAVSVAVALISARRPLLYAAALTFAIQILIGDTVFRPRPLTAGLSEPAHTPRHFLRLDLESDRAYYFFTLIVLLAVLMGLHRLRHSRFGRSMVAVGHDPVAAAAQGISPTAARTGAFAVAGLLAGVAGVLYAPLFRFDVGSLQWTFVQSLVYVAIAIVAGSGPGIAVVLVALAATLPWQLSGFYGEAGSHEIVAGAALLVATALGPRALGRLGPVPRSRRRPALDIPTPAGRPWRRRRAVGLVALSMTAAAVVVAAHQDHVSMPAGVTEFSLGGNVRPSSITRGPDGNLWFTQDRRIGRITPGGQVTEFGDLRPYDRADGIVAAGGSLWFTEGSAIARISTAGGFHDFDRGAGPLTAGSDGNAWFSLAGSIWRVTGDGAFTDFHIDHGVRNASPPVVGPDGNLWFSDLTSNQIGRITPSGHINLYDGLPTDAHADGLVAGPDGNLWFTVSGQNLIGRITPDGHITIFTGLPPDARPRELTAGPDGNVWFLGTDTHIGRITPGGTITTFGGLPAGLPPNKLTAGPDGNLWFLCGAEQSSAYTTGNHRLARITPSGVVTVYHVPGPDLLTLVAGPNNTLWFTAENDDEYYPSSGAIGRVDIARLTAGP